MGQQQLLLIILGVVVVGIALAVGITMFSDRAISSNREAVLNDMLNLASRAQQYYRRPASLGGGQGSFNGLTTIKQLTSKPTNANGSYALVTGSPIRLVGTGTELGNDGVGPVSVTMYVYPDSTVVDEALTN